MMKIIFTLCSNNYLAQAHILAASARLHQPSWKFLLGLVDTRDTQIDYELMGFDVLEASRIEPAICQLAQKYSIVELNTCLKPAFFQYLFQTFEAEAVIYMDPDTCLYGPMTEVEDSLKDHNIVLTPHLYTPIPLDGLTPAENLFLNYGIYNLGFLAVKRSEESGKFLAWWKERTYALGYDRPAQGLFTDQLWINLVPLYFKGVWVLQHSGYNMAPWNLHERILEASHAPLVFYHFSGFDPEKERFHKDYTRFTWHQRPDLHPLYKDYKVRLEKERYSFYRSLPCHYVLQPDKKTTAQIPPSLPVRLTRRLKRLIPAGWKKLALNFIKA